MAWFTSYVGSAAGPDRFDGKRALVTGGGSGIGRAVCLAFAREGADVGVADVSLEKAEATAREAGENDRKALALQVDVTDPAAVKAMVDRAVAELGRIDILVNSAGVREIVPFLQLPFEEWQRVLATNLTGTFLCSGLTKEMAMELADKGRRTSGMLSSSLP